jgi:hypothetical protein
MSQRRPSRQHRTAAVELPTDLFVMPGLWPRPGRPFKHDVETWRVVDNWPASVPVTSAEIDVFESWFGAFFDELFGSP